MISNTPGRIARVAGIFLVLSAIAWSTTGASSAPSVVTAHEIATQPGGPSDPAEVKAFLDQLIAPQLEKHHIPGAVVVVVKDGRVLYAGGYGMANFERQLPFVPDETLFRIGSTSKLITWTAVMQLAEQGRIDLDADVNTYLGDFQIPATYPGVITMKHLMTHSAGFEDGMAGAIAAAPQDMVPLGEYVMKNVQARVRPPGELTAYSNYGATLAGYIVEAVSGLPFELYVEKHIFAPLGMNHSTFRQPLPEGLAEHLAVSYDYKEGFRAQPMLYINQIPAGAMSATATDLARFMIAHLQDGRHDNARILDEPTAQQMHTRLFSNDSRLSGMTYGFFDQEINGRRVLHHGGGFPSYIGMMALLPEDQSGFYVGYNSLGGSLASSEFMTAYFDHYYPRDTGLELPHGYKHTEPAGAFAGTYRSSRVIRSSLEAIANLMDMGYVRVSEAADGMVLMEAEAATGYQAITAQEIGPRLFATPDGRKRFAFGGMRDGAATLLFVDDSPHVTFERIPWYDAPSVRLRILAISLLLLLSHPVAGGVRLIAGRRRAVRGEPSAHMPDLIATGLAGSAILVIVAILGFLWMSAIGQGRGPYATLVQAAGWLSVLLTFSVMTCAIWAWIQSLWSPLRRIHYTLVAVAAPGLLSCLDYWNVIDLPL